MCAKSWKLEDCCVEKRIF